MWYGDEAIQAEHPKSTFELDFFNWIFWIKGNNCSFTDCIKFGTLLWPVGLLKPMLNFFGMTNSQGRELNFDVLKKKISVGQAGVWMLMNQSLSNL